MTETDTYLAVIEITQVCDGCREDIRPWQAHVHDPIAGTRLHPGCRIRVVRSGHTN